MNNTTRILIRNGTVWDGKALFPSDILICDGRIAKISENIRENADLCLDAKNRIVSAGLADFHTHIKGISPDHIGIDSDKITEPFGVTHLLDASAEIGDIHTVLSSKADISVLARVHIFDNKADFTLTEEILEKYYDKVIGLKVYLDTSFTEVADARPLKEICEYARARGLFVMVHTTNSPIGMREIVDTLSQGDIISHAFHGGANNAAEDDFAALKAAKEKGVLLDSAFAGGYHIDYSLFKDAIAKGLLPDMISTDITKELEYIGADKYGITTCMSIAEKCGMCTEDILRCVTVHPMKVLKGENNRGYLKVGDKADLAVFQAMKADMHLTDRYNHAIIMDKSYKCVFTVHGSEVSFH